MICNECQHDMAEHRLYGCNAGAEEEAEKAAIYDEAWQALPAWVTDACEPNHCGDWPRYWLSFQWMTTEDDTLLLMPHVDCPDARRRMRINYCPACGADVRDCIVSRERFREVMKSEKAQ